MGSTPRRTLRISDSEWNAGHAKAQSCGETLTDALRRLLAGYLFGNADELSDYGTAYQATQRDAASSIVCTRS